MTTKKAAKSLTNKMVLSAIVVFACLITFQNLNAQTITGTVAAPYLVSGSPVNSTLNGVLSMSFEDNTAGTNLSLCVGTVADFEAGTCNTQLASSGGPGFIFLAVQDAAKLNGKWLYVIRNVGSVAAKFTLVFDPLTITGTAAAPYLVSGSAVNSTLAGVLRISFQDNTAGTNLSLCAGTIADFEAGTCGTLLASSGGPGFIFLAVQDAAKLNGKSLYVIRTVGDVAANFTIVIN
jgi:hypothetical protein